MTAIESKALVPHVITAALTILVQLLMAAFVYGQISTMVSIHTDEIKALQHEKLDSAIYFREHPYSLETARGAEKATP